MVEVSTAGLAEVKCRVAVLIAQVRVGTVVQESPNAERAAVVSGDSQSLATEHLVDGIDGRVGSHQLVDHR